MNTTQCYTSLVVLLDPADAANLRERATTYGTTQSAILRSLIERKLRIPRKRPKAKHPRRVAVLLPLSLHNALQRTADKHNTTISDTLRELLHEWLTTGATWPPV